ncbi:MAG: hypothetical protein PHU85_04835, partial [Phycisphaerae bacterium]|nr:hypothetical protein [Phycisphaerae bacterium]
MTRQRGWMPVLATGVILLATGAATAQDVPPNQPASITVPMPALQLKDMLPDQPIAQQGAQAQPGIFVPPARGAGETLDGRGKSPLTQPETVSTRRGDKLVGRVLALSADGRLTLASPQYDGEVKVLTSALEYVELAAKAVGDGRDLVVATNGDQIVGDVKTITADSVTIDSDAAGPLKLSRKMVSTISLGKATDSLLDSSFARGVMDPWKSNRGNWKVTDGLLVCESSGNTSTISAALDQDAPITIEVALEAGNTGGRPLSMFLALFVDNPATNTYGQNNVYASLNYSDVSLGWYQGGGSSSARSGSISQIRGAATMRFAYDPES